MTKKVVGVGKKTANKEAKLVSVELWTNDCYGCDREGKYDDVRHFVIAQQLPLRAFKVIRPILNPSWLEKSKQWAKKGLELPLVKLGYDDGEEAVFNYGDFFGGVKND